MRPALLLHTPPQRQLPALLLLAPPHRLPHRLPRRLPRRLPHRLPHRQTLLLLPPPLPLRLQKCRPAQVRL
jgi:hypothetical protein